MAWPLDYLLQLMDFMFYIQMHKNPSESLVPFPLAGKRYF